MSMAMASVSPPVVSAQEETPMKKPGTAYSNLIIGEGRYRLIEEIGNGCFSDVYRAVSLDDKEEVAVKLSRARMAASRPALCQEQEIYKMLHGGDGIPRMKWFGPDIGSNMIVMDLLGPSLQDHFNFCGEQLSIETVVMLAPQMIERLRYIHGKYLIHCDLKPANFLMGLGRNARKVYLIDFGLARKEDMRVVRPQAHIVPKVKPPSDKITLHGNPRFSSINNHDGGHLSRWDDLEGLSYIFIYFLKGSLPWDGGNSENKRDYYNRIKQIKMDTPIEVLCKSCPPQFATFIRYCREASFGEYPDYEYLQNLFLDYAKILCIPDDFEFDWEVKRELEETREEEYDEENEAEDEEEVSF